MNEDILYHIAWTKVITTSGHVLSNDIYPILHISYSIFSDILGIDVRNVVQIVLPLPTVQFMFGMLLLISRIASNLNAPNKIKAIGVIVISPLYFSHLHTAPHTTQIALGFVPYLLYFSLTKYTSRSDMILILLFSFVLSFSHPLVSIMTIPLLVIFGSRSGEEYILPVIFGTLLGYWVSSFNSVLNNIILVTSGLFPNHIQSTSQTSANTVSILSQFSSIISGSGVTPVDLIQIFILRYSHIALILILGACVSAVLLYRIIINEKKPAFREVNVIAAFLYGCILFFTFLGGFFLVQSPIRASRLAVIFSVLIIILGYSHYIDSDQNNKVLQVVSINRLITITFILIITVSMLNIYPSPLIGKSNVQLSQTAVESVDWLGNYGSGQVTMTPGINLNKLQRYLYGYNQNEYGKLNWVGESLYPPSGFGYSKNSSLSTTISDRTEHGYLVTNSFLKEIHKSHPPSVRQAATKYPDSSFNDLVLDKSVHKIYDSGDSQIWDIY